MMRLAILVTMSLLAAVPAFADACGELECRSNGLAYVSAEGGIVIMPGEAFSVELKIERGKIAGVTPRKRSADLANSIELEFRKGMLILKNHSGQMIRIDGYMKLSDGRFVHTSLCPLYPDIGAFESWSDSIEFLELRNLRFISDGEPTACM